MLKNKSIYSIRPLFPKKWSQKKIITYAIEIVKDPSSLIVQLTGKPEFLPKVGIARPAKFVTEGIREGVLIRVIFEKEGPQVITAYPLRRQNKI